jgi:hypothetical protein
MERRKNSVNKSSSLPVDYLKMVNEVLTGHFEAGLKTYHQYKPDPYFDTHGQIFSDEIVVSVSLAHPGHLAATTVYASCDFDSKASAPTVEDLLNVCVDAIGTVFSQLLDIENPDQLKNIARDSLSSLENMPFQWTEMEINQRSVFLKIDKSNPKLDEMAENWLKSKGK